MKEYQVDLALWDAKGESVSIREFKFDNLCDAMRFATDVTDHYFGLERIDVSIHWVRKAR